MRRDAIAALLAATLWVVAGCSDSTPSDPDTGQDAAADAGAPDPGGSGGDAGADPDVAPPDAGPVDAGLPDAGLPDAGLPDAGLPDAGTPDSGLPDAGGPDVGTPDAGIGDSGGLGDAMDAGPDVGGDLGAGDAGVDSGPLNTAPTFAPVGPLDVTEGQAVSFVVAATDAEGDAITLAGVALPAGASFEPTTGALAWTPGFDQTDLAAGAVTVTLSFTATDDGDPVAVGSLEVALTVHNDDDQDGLSDDDDPCVSDPLNDDDSDGVCAADDNCPAVFNDNQVDTDGDTLGDACDDDDDGDGELDGDDNCPLVENADQSDVDGDGVGDLCDDDDGDGVLDLDDNCPDVPNDAQLDYDGDGLGFVCDAMVRLPDAITGLAWAAGTTVHQRAAGGTVITGFAPTVADAATCTTEGCPDSGVVVFEGGAIATEMTSGNSGGLPVAEGIVDGSGAAWISLNDDPLARVDGGVVVAPYGATTGVVELPDGAVLVTRVDALDRWLGDAETPLLGGLTAPPTVLAFEAVTYVLSDAGDGSRTLWVYDAASVALAELLTGIDQVTAHRLGARTYFDVTRVAGGARALHVHEPLGALLPVLTDASELLLWPPGPPEPGDLWVCAVSAAAPTPTLHLVDGPQLVADHDVSLPTAASCADVIPLPLLDHQDHAAQAELNGTRWLRTSAAGVHQIVRWAGAGSAPTVVLDDAPSATEIHVALTRRYLVAPCDGQAAEDCVEVYRYDAAAGLLVSVTGAFGRDSEIRRGKGGAIGWVDRSHSGGTPGDPERLVAITILDDDIDSADLPITGYTGAEVTYAALDSLRVLWLNVSHGDPAGSAHDVFTQQLGIVALQFPSGGPDAMATYFHQGTRLIATRLTTYLATTGTNTNAVLTHAATPIPLLPAEGDHLDPQGDFWLTFEQADGTWSFGTIEATGYKQILVATERPRGSYDRAGHAYVLWTNPGLALWNLHRVTNGVTEPMLIGFEEAPTLHQPAEAPDNLMWVLGYATSSWDGYYAFLVMDGASVSNASLYSNEPLQVRGDTFLVGLTTTGGGDQTALCTLDADGPVCHAVPVEPTMTPPFELMAAAPPEPGGQRVAVLADDTTGYLWQALPEPVDAGCCQVDYDNAGCGMASITACVCALDAYCCNSAWDDDCLFTLDACGGCPE